MFTEREKSINVPEEVGVIPNQPEIPRHIEEGDGVQVVHNQQNPVTISDTGNVPVAQNDPVVTITLPSDPQALTQQVKKGKIQDSFTWLSAFWLRMFKKALFFGWKVENK